MWDRASCTSVSCDAHMAGDLCIRGQWFWAGVGPGFELDMECDFEFGILLGPFELWRDFAEEFS